MIRTKISAELKVAIQYKFAWARIRSPEGALTVPTSFRRQKRECRRCGAPKADVTKAISLMMRHRHC
jgi:ribosomal protein S14